MAIHKELLEEVEQHITAYKEGKYKRAWGRELDVRKKIIRTTAYSNSEYTKLMKDEFGNELRFRNIGNSIVDLEWRAKNLDRKNIEAVAVDGDYVYSMIVNRETQNYMKNNDWGQFIDDFQFKKSQYGEAAVKDCEEGPDIVNWTTFYFNPLDIMGGIKVQEFSMSPMEVRKKGWEGEVKTALEAHKKEKNMFEDMVVLDIEGEFPAYYFDPTEEDETRTVLKNLIWADCSGKKYELHSMDIDKSRYLSFSRKKIEGCDFGVGVWDEVAEPQMATNQAVIAEQEALTLSGKIALRTNKKDLPDARGIHNGETIYLADGEYIDSLNLMPSGGLAQYQNSINNWFENMQRDQSAYNSVTGGEQKAGTAFASLALQAAQSGSIFNKRRDQDGYNIRDILVKMVWPRLVKQINKTHELTAAYSPRELKMIDEAIKNKEANKAKKERILSGKIVDDEFIQETMDRTQANLDKYGDTRTVNIPEGYLTMEKIEKKIRFDITDEQSDGARRLNALTTQLQLLSPEDPERKLVVAELMEIQGISASSFPGGDTGTVAPQAGNTTQTERTIESALPVGQQ